MASDPLTPAATWDDVRTPVSGEPGSAGALTASTIQPLTNRTHWLRQLLSYGLGAVGIDVASIRSRGISSFDAQCIFNGTFDMRGTTNFLGQTAAALIVQNGCSYTPDGDREFHSYELLNLTSDVARGSGSAQTLIVTNMNGADRVIVLNECPNPFSGARASVRYVVHDGSSNNLTVLNAALETQIVLTAKQRVRMIQAPTWRVGG